MLRLDHVVLATPDLELGHRQLQQAFGLDSLPGGTHGAWGTANRIVPLGDQYLELVAAVDLELAADSPLGRAVLAAAERDRLSPIGLCLATDSLDELADRLHQEVEEGARQRPDGVELHWRTVGVGRAFGPERLPFFISWEDQAQHPSRTRAEHRVEATGIAQVEVGGPEGAILDWLGGQVPGVLPVGGPPGVRSLQVELRGGGLLELP